MNLNSASPSILMSVIALLSLVRTCGHPGSPVTVAATAPHVAQLRASRLRRRPRMERQTAECRIHTSAGKS